MATTVRAALLRRLRAAALRALPIVLLFCAASPLLAEANHAAHGPASSGQLVLANDDGTAAPHETFCVECAQHAWDRGRDTTVVPLLRRVATGRVAHALIDDDRRSSIHDTITEPPRV